MPQGINPMHDEFLRTRCFPTLQTGAWRPGEWLYRVSCLRCEYEELAETRDEAWAILKAHNPKSFSVKEPHKQRPVEDVEWEDFF